MFTICGERYVTKREFNCWVRDMNNSYLEFTKKRNHFKCYSYCDRGVANPNFGDPIGKNRITMIVNLKTQKVAFSKCHKDDEFETSVGVAIAWARYMNKPIPKEVEYAKPRNLKVGTKVFYTNSITGSASEAYYVGTVYDDANKQRKYLFNFGTPKRPIEEYLSLDSLKNIMIVE